MPLPLRRTLLLFALLVLSLLAPSLAQAAGVEPRFELSSPTGSPFPSDRFTVRDWTQLTGLRVALPKPDCATRPSDCEDVDVLNDLDGFNVQPRISIPFTGELDPSSVSSESVFLVRLTDEGGRRSEHEPELTGINQVVWNPALDTLHVESDELLAQGTRYLLVVTRDVRDAAGDRIDAAPFRQALKDDRDYREDLLEALRTLPDGVKRRDVAVASIFTTQSVTALLEQVRRQIKASTPAPATSGSAPAAPAPCSRSRA